MDHLVSSKLVSEPFARMRGEAREDGYGDDAKEGGVTGSSVAHSLTHSIYPSLIISRCNAWRAMHAPLKLMGHVLGSLPLIYKHPLSLRERAGRTTPTPFLIPLPFPFPSSLLPRYPGHNQRTCTPRDTMDQRARACCKSEKLGVMLCIA
jgi:hypothetical protein